MRRLPPTPDPFVEPETRSVHVYMRADVAAPGSIAAHIDHARALYAILRDGCLVVADGVGTHYYPITSVARWTIERTEP